MENDTTSNGRLPPIYAQPGSSLETVRRWSHYLDKAFRIPGTRMRFGWDPILGLIPGLGDVATGLFSLLLLITAFRLRVPGIIRVRMILNAVLDLAFGTIPFLGDLFDFAYKSNSRNLSLLEKHAHGVKKPQLADWLFVVATLAVAAAIVMVPLLVLWAALEKLKAE